MRDKVQLHENRNERRLQMEAEPEGEACPSFKVLLPHIKV